jgi:hypothetical protein
MAGQRGSRARRTRGSWTPRIIGIVVAAVLAAGAVAVYLSTASQPASQAVQRLADKVRTVQTVGLIDQGPPSGASAGPRLLRVSSRGLEFSPLTPSERAAGNPQWTADHMANGGYIFIYVPDGRCLTSAGTPARALLRLRHCDLGADQRWAAVRGSVRAGGHVFAQYRSLSSGRCLAAGGAATGQADLPAELARCAPARPWQQLVSFWWAA